MKSKETQALETLKALADANRLETLLMLREGELCSCKILEHFNISQPTLSYHMKVLLEAGLVEKRKDSQRTLYRLKMETLDSLSAFLLSICSTSQSAANTIHEESMS